MQQGRENVCTITIWLTIGERRLESGMEALLPAITLQRNVEQDLRCAMTDIKPSLLSAGQGAYTQASTRSVAPGTGNGEGTSTAENGSARPLSWRSHTLYTG